MPANRDQFNKFFDELEDEVIAVAANYGLPSAALDWYRRSLRYNSVGGKANRGLSVIDTYEILLGKDLSDDEWKKAAILGWCIELLQAFFLVADDMMDQSKTRRGQPCWYLVSGVGNVAINDSFMLETAIYILLKNHFKQESYYVDLIELFHEVTFQTELGQILDLITAPEDSVDLSKFSLEKHSFIVRFKTAYYSFYLPVALAMYMAGVASDENLKQAKDILIPLGEYFQVQDDYLDCYGKPEVIGKIGTDIIDNKCSWLINLALKKASPEQRAILDANYGRKDNECEDRVRKVYDELSLEQEYFNYEEQIVAMIRDLIKKVDYSTGLKPEVFEAFLSKIYKRQK
ncbi:hypothetical protein CANCADRAFT_93315 [Tortispora caseinolytica NRRL Y-17796]|uniref:Farnesyl pyrophosphate synthase n=1 Tax=Tortispora caseinolytica NRRL Y-17796 TaxID=767744 RepID=A0A1E4TLZ6_9ASCO|nr:hypothetical protein CANCADRAFT_93315 [Tortispora caseinolytica NRRL Y-17796]